MKRTLAALALLSVVGASGDALAVTVWHCEAHPPGVPLDQHSGFGLTQPQAAARALAVCSAAHHGIPCQLGLCHIDHP
ncbi:MAG: hypothetical protein QM820_38755 [Minicystis sp.]